MTAVSVGSKGMAMYTLLQSQVENGDHEYTRIINLAKELELVVVHDNDPVAGSVMIFVCRQDQVWRAQAYSLLWRSFAFEEHWSESAEKLNCRLLGYTENQIIEWLNLQRWSRLGFDGQTIYLLITDRQRDAISEVGNTGIPSQAMADGITVFWYRGNAVLKRDAAVLLPSGLNIARAAISQRVFFEWFRPGKMPGRDGLFLSELGKEALTFINSSFCCKLQFLGIDGWMGQNVESIVQFAASLDRKFSASG